MYFRVMDNVHFDNLVCQALFGDGALVVVIGADPVVATAGGSGGERPLFELVHATQTLIPETGGAILGLLREAGLLKMVSGAGVDFTDDDDRNAAVLCGPPGRAHHPRQGGGCAGPEAGEDEGVAQGARRLRQHGQRVRLVLGGGQPAKRAAPLARGASGAFSSASAHASPWTPSN
uniref:Uncharacterized protein n=1 Tax=Oryza nivara TaxID=4536 RepID=A0A0E0GRN7_ORYNI